MKDDVSRVWIITVQGNYGNFMVTGTEKEVEERRKFKANWEHTITRKRLPTKEELTTGKIDPCYNHPNFHSKDRYFCKCPKCVLIKRRFKIEKIKNKLKN